MCTSEKGFARRTGSKFSTTNRVAQLTIEYFESSLTVEHLGRDGIRVGMRAPDAKVVQAIDKKTISLFDLLYR